jgi:uncharacterized membrane protein HdeD (DUF308 family)
MKRSRRWLFSIIGAILIVFGLLCLNYTKPHALTHHREFARRHNLPQPASSILWLGAVSIASGSAMVGYAFGASRGLPPSS